MPTTKQQRKYNIKPEEKTDKAKPVKGKQTSAKQFRVLIDNANFLQTRFETQEEAETAGTNFVGKSGSSFVVVGGCN